MSPSLLSAAALLPLFAVPAMLMSQEPRGPGTTPLLVTWRGSIADEKILGSPPVVIGNPDEWKKLWEGWKLPGEVPEVDFGRCLVLVQTTRGGRLRMSAKLDDGGDLTIAAVSTRDLRAGFRYAIGVVQRKGIKTVAGAEPPGLPAE
ncbi:MAG: hypothetical protein EHM42_15970 [Planctomycetaceae bacterium]|nr:MAG: hypothetical protein EHM42_15970 [Planctomycetaceae bacterium]